MRLWIYTNVPFQCISMTLLVTSAACKRRFSCLRRLKNQLVSGEQFTPECCCLTVPRDPPQVCFQNGRAPYFESKKTTSAPKSCPEHQQSSHPATATWSSWPQIAPSPTASACLPSPLSRTLFHQLTGLWRLRDCYAAPKHFRVTW